MKKFISSLIIISILFNQFIYCKIEYSTDTSNSNIGLPSIFKETSDDPIANVNNHKLFKALVDLYQQNKIEKEDFEILRAYLQKQTGGELEMFYNNDANMPKINLSLRKRLLYSLELNSSDHFVDIKEIYKTVFIDFLNCYGISKSKVEDFLEYVKKSGNAFYDNYLVEVQEGFNGYKTIMVRLIENFTIPITYLFELGEENKYVMVIRHLDILNGLSTLSSAWDDNSLLVKFCKNNGLDKNFFIPKLKNSLLDISYLENMKELINKYYGVMSEKSIKQIFDDIYLVGEKLLRYFVFPETDEECFNFILSARFLAVCLKFSHIADSPFSNLFLKNLKDLGLNAVYKKDGKISYCNYSVPKRQYKSDMDMSFPSVVISNEYSNYALSWPMLGHNPDTTVEKCKFYVFILRFLFNSMVGFLNIFQGSALNMGEILSRMSIFKITFFDNITGRAVAYDVALLIFKILNVLKTAEKDTAGNLIKYVRQQLQFQEDKIREINFDGYVIMSLIKAYPNLIEFCQPSNLKEELLSLKVSTENSFQQDMEALTEYCKDRETADLSSLLKNINVKALKFVYLEMYKDEKIFVNNFFIAIYLGCFNALGLMILGLSNDPVDFDGFFDLERRENYVVNKENRILIANSERIPNLCKKQRLNDVAINKVKEMFQRSCCNLTNVLKIFTVFNKRDTSFVRQGKQSRKTKTCKDKSSVNKASAAFKWPVRRDGKKFFSRIELKDKAGIYSLITDWWILDYEDCKNTLRAYEILFNYFRVKVYLLLESEVGAEKAEEVCKNIVFEYSIVDAMDRVIAKEDVVITGRLCEELFEIQENLESLPRDISNINDLAYYLKDKIAPNTEHLTINRNQVGIIKYFKEYIRYAFGDVLAFVKKRANEEEAAAKAMADLLKKEDDEKKQPGSSGSRRKGGKGRKKKSNANKKRSSGKGRKKKSNANKKRSSGKGRKKKNPSNQKKKQKENPNVANKQGTQPNVDGTEAEEPNNDVKKGQQKENSKKPRDNKVEKPKKLPKRKNRRNKKNKPQPQPQQEDASAKKAAEEEALRQEQLAKQEFRTLQTENITFYPFNSSSFCIVSSENLTDYFPIMEKLKLKISLKSKELVDGLKVGLLSRYVISHARRDLTAEETKILTPLILITDKMAWKIEVIEKEYNVVDLLLIYDNKSTTLYISSKRLQGWKQASNFLDRSYYKNIVKELVFNAPLTSGLFEMEFCHPSIANEKITLRNLLDQLIQRKGFLKVQKYIIGSVVYKYLFNGDFDTPINDIDIVVCPPNDVNIVGLDYFLNQYLWLSSIWQKAPYQSEKVVSYWASLKEVNSDRFVNFDLVISKYGFQPPANNFEAMVLDCNSSFDVEILRQDGVGLNQNVFNFAKQGILLPNTDNACGNLFRAGLMFFRGLAFKISKKSLIEGIFFNAPVISKILFPWKMILNINKFDKSEEESMNDFIEKYDKYLTEKDNITNRFVEKLKKFISKHGNDKRLGMVICDLFYISVYFADQFLFNKSFNKSFNDGYITFSEASNCLNKYQINSRTNRSIELQKDNNLFFIQQKILEIKLELSKDEFPDIPNINMCKELKEAA